ncbi:hypothetical protein C6A86_023555 [Mycobacterium sp. ITM-2016-00316]|uniref:hypothetical protein n=1 Tax=Mycobacterium sp. ITM-2016-00316 TaxID=2099695 RepID=UPI001156EFB9|nr:hypothetical protein [Mycobacterium sp. ITM-2016-00316]WNG81138.1 hypothetical protein C6A86_023555 [Mycobacterium sp. ITM-2016-00316]
MIVENDPGKQSGYRAFERHYRAKRVDIEFRIMNSAPDAIATLSNAGERCEFDGVIADFGLGGDRPDVWHARVEVPGPAGSKYTVSTGLGVLDWAHAADPTLRLWALTNDSAAHAPLFMSAATLWLNAKPLSITRFDEPGGPLADRLVEELLKPELHAKLNPAWKRVLDASAALDAMLNVEYSDEEAFDWLHALTSLEGVHRGFIKALNARIQAITQNPQRRAFANTLSPAMAAWQIYLEEVHQGFPDVRQKNRWPQFDVDHLPRALKAWDSFNPFTDFLAVHRECREFFGSEDVRFALTRWRDGGQHR